MHFKKQQGAAAIEFAILFPIFFLIFYAIITYGLIFAAQQTLTLAAAEGARAAVRYPASLPSGQNQLQARQKAACDMANNALEWLRQVGQGLGSTGCMPDSASDAAGIYVFADVCDVTSNINVSCVKVHINYNYAGSPLIPKLLGPVMSLPTPDILRGTAVAQVSLLD